MPRSLYNRLCGLRSKISKWCDDSGLNDEHDMAKFESQITISELEFLACVNAALLDENDTYEILRRTRDRLFDSYNRGLDLQDEVKEGIAHAALSLTVPIRPLLDYLAHLGRLSSICLARARRIDEDLVRWCEADSSKVQQTLLMVSCIVFSSVSS